MLDLVEEALDAVAYALEVRAEADRLPTIAFRRDVGPRTLFVDKRPDPAGIVSISKEHDSRRKTAEQCWTKPVVMSLARRDAQSEGKALAVNHYMQLARQASPRASYSLVAAVGDAGSMLVDSEHWRVDHLRSGIVRDRQGLHDPAPDAGPPPANEAIIASGEPIAVVWLLINNGGRPRPLAANPLLELIG
jgi:hypothetical protein